MKFKMIPAILVLTIAAWSQTATTQAPAPEKPSDQTKMSCCHGMKDHAKDGMSCCKHDAKDGKAMNCCKPDGKGASCCAGKDGKMACMKGDKDKAASCCGNAECCKDGKGCCGDSKDATQSSMQCCGDRCERHVHTGGM